MSEPEAGAAQAVSEGNAASAVSTPEPTMTDTMAAVFDKMNPQERVDRSESGQFRSKNETKTSREEGLTEGQTQSELKGEPAQPAIVPPQSLPAELRERFGSVPPEIAEWVGKREAESHKRITELGEAAKAYQPIRQVIEQFSSSFRKHGLQPADAFARMMAVNDMLEQDAGSAIGEIAKAYGVDLSTLVTKAQDGAQENDYVRSLEAKIARLEKAVSETSNRVLTREQREADERSQSLAKLVEDFASDKADHWSDIEADVLEQIAAINARQHDLTPEKVLQKAYERAVKINEAVSERLNEAKRKADEAKAEAERKRKADEAKKLASMNVKSGKGVSPNSSGKWEDTMREVANRLMG